jgi:protein transport protein YIF1
MSMITYVLLCALCYGTAKHFDPEIIPDVTTKCFVTQILEVIAIRFGFSLMHAPVSILDLFSYTGYKYVGLSLNMFVGLVLGHFLGYGHRAYYITFLWTASAVSYFMLKTMANNIPVVTSATGPKREVMVVAFAASQFATMWFVSQTKFL